ncbi:spermatogenesis-associated protein 31D1-like [Mesocricetus auratus]|uniref:Spermatogenesis-associated protein 31D1-like n=1 Tax=Mesocricetus auratus TaxID=10036 RepID=A0ABM2YB63_MESAU|nr:spermatogenesis-associated protein 31D1-like [Mesocricetus auratus]
MENILSSLNSLAETWLVFGSVSCHVDLHYTLLSGLGLLLVYVCYLVLKLAVPSLWKKKCTQKLQEKAEGARESQKGEGTFQRAEERRKMQTAQQSPLEEPYGATCRDRLLHPDPLFDVCHGTGCEVSHLPPQAALEDGGASHSRPASTAPAAGACDTANHRGCPVTPQGPLPLAPSVLRPKHFALLERWLSSSPPGSTPTSGPRFLRDPMLPHALVSVTLPTEGARGAEVALPGETARPPASRPSEVLANDPRTKGAGQASRPVTDPSQQRPAAGRLSPSDLGYPVNQHLPDSPASQASLQGDLPEPGHLLPPNPEALARLRGRDKKEGDFLTTKDKDENKEPFSKPSYLERLSWAKSRAKAQEPAASPSAGSKGPAASPSAGGKGPAASPSAGGKGPAASPSAGGKGEPVRLQAPHSEDEAEPKPAQLFWGPPSLHSEALPPPAMASCTHPSTFNSMAEASLADSSPPVTLSSAPLPVTKSQSQTWLQTLSQQPHSRLCDPPATGAPTHPQGHSPVPVLTLSPQSQIRICGVRFHRPQGEARPLGPLETQHLEYNVLKKEQERVWGLPSSVQKSRDTFCPSPPKLSLVSQPFKSHMPRPILLGDFPLTDELRKKLEHHLRKRLIQHRWGLPHRINESLSLMCPQSELVDFPESGRSCGLSWLSLSKDQESQDSHAIVLNGSGKFHSGALENHAREEAEVKGQTADSQDVGQKGHVQGNPEEAPGSSPQSDLKTDHEPCATSQSSLSKGSQCQKDFAVALEQHLDKKTREILEGQMPSTVKRSWRSVKVAGPPPETPPRLLKDLAPLAREEDPLKKHQHSLLISPSKEKMLEEHIKTFGKRMTFGLPQRVEESLESYKTRVEPPRSLSQFHAPSHADPAVDSVQSSRFLESSSTGRDGMQTLNFTPIQEVSLPASWPVSQVQPASENKEVFTDKGTAQSGRQSPELPMRPEDPTEERLASSTNAQGPQGERLSWRAGPMAEGSTEPLKGEPTKVLTSTQGPCSPGRDSTTCQPLQGMSAPYNPGTSDYKAQVSRGVVLHSESRPPSASGEMTSKCQGPSSGDMVASQVLRVHLPTAGVSMEPGRGPWFPAHESDKCQNQECPPAAKRESPLAAEAGKLGGGDAGLGTSQTRGKRRSVQARAPEETHGHTASPALSPKGQPPENHFTSQVKCFLQWMSPGQKHKGQERSLAKGSSPSPPVKVSSLIKGRCDFYRSIEAQKCVRDPGVILRKPLGHRHGTVIPCPQAPAPPPVGSGETQQKEQRRGSCCQAACSQVQKAESCSPGEGQTAPKRCGVAGKAEMVISPMRASQGIRVPPKSCL